MGAWVLLAVMACGAGVCAGAQAAAPRTGTDAVTLANGDRVHGSLVQIKGGSVSLKTKALGTLAIPLKQVTALRTGAAVTLVVPGQAPVKGELALAGPGTWRVTSADGTTRNVPAASVEIILPNADYQALMHHQAAVWQDWSGTASLGYALQSGDQTTRNFNATLVAVRERPPAPIFLRHWQTNVGVTVLLAHAAQNGTQVTSNTVSGSLRQNYLFAPNDFVFATAQLDHIGAQSLDLRQVYGGGVGRDLIHTSATLFSGLAGVTYVRQKFVGGIHTQNAEGLLGERLGIQFSPRTRLDQNFNFYPNLSSSGGYRFDTATTLSAKLNREFSLTASVVDFYLSRLPVAGHKNNVTFTTGVGFTF